MNRENNTEQVQHQRPHQQMISLLKELTLLTPEEISLTETDDKKILTILYSHRIDLERVLYAMALFYDPKNITLQALKSKMLTLINFLQLFSEGEYNYKIPSSDREDLLSEAQKILGGTSGSITSRESSPDVSDAESDSRSNSEGEGEVDQLIEKQRCKHKKKTSMIDRPNQARSGADKLIEAGVNTFSILPGESLRSLNTQYPDIDYPLDGLKQLAWILALVRLSCSLYVAVRYAFFTESLGVEEKKISKLALIKDQLMRKEAQNIRDLAWIPGRGIECLAFFAPYSPKITTGLFMLVTLSYGYQYYRDQQLAKRYIAVHRDSENVINNCIVKGLIALKNNLAKTTLILMALWGICTIGAMLNWLGSNSDGEERSFPQKIADGIGSCLIALTCIVNIGFIYKKGWVLNALFNIPALENNVTLFPTIDRYLVRIKSSKVPSVLSSPRSPFSPLQNDSDTASTAIVSIIPQSQEQNPVSSTSVPPAHDEHISPISERSSTAFFSIPSADSPDFPSSEHSSSHSSFNTV